MYWCQSKSILTINVTRLETYGHIGRLSSPEQSWTCISLHRWYMYTFTATSGKNSDVKFKVSCRENVKVIELLQHLFEGLTGDLLQGKLSWISASFNEVIHSRPPPCSPTLNNLSIVLIVFMSSSRIDQLERCAHQLWLDAHLLSS